MSTAHRSEWRHLACSYTDWTTRTDIWKHQNSYCVGTGCVTMCCIGMGSVLLCAVSVWIVSVKAVLVWIVSVKAVSVRTVSECRDTSRLHILGSLLWVQCSQELETELTCWLYVFVGQSAGLLHCIRNQCECSLLWQCQPEVAETLPIESDDHMHSFDDQRFKQWRRDVNRGTDKDMHPREACAPVQCQGVLGLCQECCSSKITFSFSRKLWSLVTCWGHFTSGVRIYNDDPVSEVILGQFNPTARGECCEYMVASVNMTNAFKSLWDKVKATENLFSPVQTLGGSFPDCFGIIGIRRRARILMLNEGSTITSVRPRLQSLFLSHKLDKTEMSLR